MTYGPDLRPAPETRLTHVTAMREEDQFTVAYPVGDDRTFYLTLSAEALEADQQAHLCRGATVEVTLWPELTSAQKEAQRAKGQRITRVDGIPMPTPEDIRVESVFPRPITQGKIGAALLWVHARRWEHAMDRIR